MLHHAADPTGASSASSPRSPPHDPSTPRASSQHTDTPRSVLGRRSRGAAESDPEDSENSLFSLGPRKRPSRAEPLLFNGRHFGRTVYAFCRVFPLLKEGLARHIQHQAGILNLTELSEHEKREHRIFKELLNLSPGLDLRVLNASEQELHYISDMIRKGSSAARSDDTKSLKSVIVDWITPAGGSLVPPISRNIKTDRGFYHYTTGELLCPPTLNWADAAIREKLKSGEILVTSDSWPAFVYSNHKLIPDKPWEGLFRGKLLLCAFKHVFTSPSSVEKDARATRSGNADLHGMTAVTIPSLAYITTMVRFSLSSAPVFSRNDKSLDSEGFYRSIIEFLEDPVEKKEVEELLQWWNMKVFPSHHATEKTPAVQSVKDKLKQWRKERTLQDQNNAQP